MNRTRSLYLRLRNKCAPVKAFFYDKMLGIETKANHHLAIANGSFNKDAEKHEYGPTSYGMLKRIFDYLKLTPNDTVVDLGSGKGRVVFFVALQRLKKVIGVEIDGELIEIAKENLRRLKRRNAPIEFIHADAAQYKFTEENIILMSNPFGHKTLEAVIKNIKESLVIQPRKIHVIYYIPIHRDLLDSQDWLVLKGKIKNHNCLVWCNEDKGAD